MIDELTEQGHSQRTVRLRYQGVPRPDVEPAQPAAGSWQARLDAWAAETPKLPATDLRIRAAVRTAIAQDQAAWKSLNVEVLLDAAERTARGVQGNPPSPQPTARYDASEYRLSAQLSAGAVPSITAAGITWAPLVEITVGFFFRTAACAQAGQLVVAWREDSVSKPIADWTVDQIQALVLDQLTRASRTVVVPRTDFPSRSSGIIDVGLGLIEQEVANA